MVSSRRYVLFADLPRASVALLVAITALYPFPAAMHACAEVVASAPERSPLGTRGTSLLHSRPAGNVSSPENACRRRPGVWANGVPPQGARPVDLFDTDGLERFDYDQSGRPGMSRQIANANSRALRRPVWVFQIRGGTRQP